MASCSFCWTDKSKVGVLVGVASENLFICDQCVEFISDIISAQKQSAETEEPTE